MRVRVGPLRAGAALFALVAPTAVAQHAGSLAGSVTLEGQPLAGVAIEARSPVLPRPRLTESSFAGEFRIPLLPPGTYTVRFTRDGTSPQSLAAEVFLDQETRVHAAMLVARHAEEVTVAAEQGLLDLGSISLRSTIPGEAVERLPVGEGYRDLVKLIPAVQYSEDLIRGPSAGGNGQDNVYQFDGVNVTRPLFGTLSAEPSSHDVDQLAVVRGGATAVGFNRAGGFRIDAISHSGTATTSGQVGYEFLTHSLTADDETGGVEFEQDKSWTTASIGGPLLRDRLFFYASYYRPVVSRDNRSTRYGEAPSFRSVRDEGFAKLTWTPARSVFIHASYRDSSRDNRAAAIGEFSAATTSAGADARLKVGFGEASWILSDRSSVTVRLADFAIRNTDRPDSVLDFRIALDGSVRFDVANLDRQGLFAVPTPRSGRASYNTFIAPLIERYGYLDAGVRKGGGWVGAAPDFNRGDAFRQAVELAYETLLGRRVTHQLHLGYQRYLDAEEIATTSNGWGRIAVLPERTHEGLPVFRARFAQQSLGESVVPTIRSELGSQTLEINDSIRVNDWTVNLGLLASEDTFYGQGLREDPTTISGFVVDPGRRYTMYRIPFHRTLQPRLGVTRAFRLDGSASVGWSRYHPAMTSLPRAASWARSLNREINAFFDAAGNLIDAQPVAGSSGKLFQEGMEARVIDEYLLSISRRIAPRWEGRAYARYRYASNFWEDTNNDARIAFDPPPGVPRELYIPDLDAKLAQLGSGSPYVIAQLDGAFTKYWEMTLEADWRVARGLVRGSYTWSHYYGTFDQDNTTLVNDQNIFAGSSFIADGPGRQIWNNRFGDLRGDRRHILKIYGFHPIGRSASAGVFAIYQSGQPWEAWSLDPWSHLPNDGSVSGRYLERAGSRRSNEHYQVDLNYTHRLALRGQELQLSLDAFNVTDNQTGYNIEPSVHDAGFGQPRAYFDPRRFQMALRLHF